MFYQQATDGGKAIWYYISSNVPSTRYETQMFVWNGHEVGNWKLGRELLSSQTSPMPYCKQAGQPPRGSINTWFSCILLIIEAAQKYMCSALKPQVRDVFFISEQYFQLMCFLRNFFPRISFEFYIQYYILSLVEMRWWWESKLILTHSFTFLKMHSIKHLSINYPMGIVFLPNDGEVLFVCFPCVCFYWWGSIFILTSQKTIFLLNIEWKYLSRLSLHTMRVNEIICSKWDFCFLYVNRPTDNICKAWGKRTNRESFL